MSEIIIGQVRFLLMTSLLGMALMGAYDVCRFVRWLIPHHRAAVALEDILFWAAASVPAYGLFFVYNDGEIRWYGALAVFLGGLLYERGISVPIRRLGNRYLTVPKKKLFRFLGRVRRRVVGSAGRQIERLKKKKLERGRDREKCDEKRKKKVHKKTKNKLHKNKK